MQRDVNNKSKLQKVNMGDVFTSFIINPILNDFTTKRFYLILFWTSMGFYKLSWEVSVFSSTNYLTWYSKKETRIQSTKRQIVLVIIFVENFLFWNNYYSFYNLNKIRIIKRLEQYIIVIPIYTFIHNLNTTSYYNSKKHLWITWMFSI